MALQTISDLTNKSTISNDDIFIHQKKFINDPRLYAIKKKHIVNPVTKLIRYSKQVSDSVTSAVKPLGEGTSKNPYKISCLANLVWLYSNSLLWNKVYFQTHNIDASAISNFTPIGNSTTKFTGIYNGNGKTISNITINNASTDYQGFFGYTNGASLSNLGVINCNINGSAAVGGLIGGISSGIVNNCYSTGNIYSNNTSVGGFIGYAISSSPKIYNCYSNANVYNSTTGSIGSLIGNVISGIIANSFSTGNVYLNNVISATSGCIGANAGTVINTYYNKDYCTSSIGTGLTSRQLMNTDMNLDTSVWKQNKDSYPSLRVFDQPSRYSKQIKILANNSNTQAYPTKAFTINLILATLPTSSVQLLDDYTYNIPITATDGLVYNYPLPISNMMTKLNDGYIFVSQAFNSGDYTLDQILPNNIILLSINVKRVAGSTNCTISVYRNNSSGLLLGTNTITTAVDLSCKILLSKKYFSNGLTKLYFNLSAAGKYLIHVKYTNIPLQVVLSKNSSVYGLMYYDNLTDYLYQRTGTLSNIPLLVNDLTILTNPVPLNLLTVHNKMRRCITNANGDVVYYLNKDNSMYRLNGADLASGTISNISLNYSAGTITLTVNVTGGSITSAVGSYVKVFIGGQLNTNMNYYALVTATNGNNLLTLSHPHTMNWGLSCDRFRVGDAKLNGSHGQVMVLIPLFYWKYSLFTQGGKSWILRLISLLLFEGSLKILKRYVGAFQGVSANSSDLVKDGWTGTWDNTNSVWNTFVTSDYTSKLFAVAGYYPQTNKTISNFRTQSVAVGTNYHQYDFKTCNVLQLLMFILIGSYNTQKKISNGITDITGSISWNNYNGLRPVRKNGDSIPAGNKTWQMNTDTKLNHKMQIAGATGGWFVKSFSYRGIENLYGNLWKFVDGINMITVEEGTARYFKAMVSDNPVNHNSDSDTGLLQLSSKVYTHAKSTDSHRYPRSTTQYFLPADTPNASNTLPSGSPESFLSDRFYVPPYPSGGSRRILLVGGSASDSSNAGAWCVSSSNGSTHSDGPIGGGLCMKNKG